MVAPITGPFSVIDFNDAVRYRSRKYYKQRKPYNLPLQYNLVDKHITARGVGGHAFSGDWWTVSNWTPYEDSGASAASARAYARAYDKFKSGIHADDAQIAVTMAERQQALDMIGKRSIQVLKAFRSVRKLRFGDAAKILGITRPAHLRDGRSLGRSVGSNWLEFWFGWSPLVGDIGNAVKLLQGSVPAFRIQGRATDSSTSNLGRTGTGPDGLIFTATGKMTTIVRWHLEAWVEVTNPNLLLANQLGFVNPATVAWELIPFSFLVDWFVNVGDFLGSFTDFWGVRLHDPFRTEMRVTQKTETNDWNYRYAPQYNWRRNATGTFVTLNRTLGSLPGPSLVVRAPKRLSLTRAVTGVSLLLQQLRK